MATQLLVFGCTVVDCVGFNPVQYKIRPGVVDGQQPEDVYAISHRKMGPSPELRV